MFDVLIVDDEEPVLESYEFMLKSFGDEFALAGKARSGYEALKQIYETEPDLVFMDINIPGIDGLSVLEETHKKYPRMVCILSTAYERFDLAQRAIPLGVFAYLVKPVSKKTFFDTLEKALAQLRSLPPEGALYEEPKLRFFRKDIWLAMKEADWQASRDELGLASDQGIVILVEFERDQEAACALLAEKLSLKHPCRYDVLMNRGLFLVSENLSREELHHYWEQLSSGLFPGGTVWRWGMGNRYHGTELYRSCGEALAELTSRRTGAEERERRGIITLREKIGREPPEDSRRLFIEIWESAFSRNCGSLSEKTPFPPPARALMVSLCTLLLDDIAETWTAENAVMPFDPAEIPEIEDLGAWKRWAEPRFEKLLLAAAEKRSGNIPVPLRKALSFLREHYREGIQLGGTAEAAGVSAEHISRLFTDHLKISFSGYLTALRIEAAERLLRDPAVTVKEAAYAVGYQDPNYFSKVFKKSTGRLPGTARGTE